MNQKKKVNLKETGITLLALVVTIIVLLILAGVTINLVLGENGIINRTQSAYQTNAEAKIIEEIQMAWGAVQVDALPKGWNNQSKSDGLQTELRKEDSTSTTSLADPIITVTYKGYETTINAGTGSMSALAKVGTITPSNSNTNDVYRGLATESDVHPEIFYYEIITPATASIKEETKIALINGVKLATTSTPGTAKIIGINLDYILSNGSGNNNVEKVNSYVNKLVIPHEVTLDDDSNYSSTGKTFKITDVDWLINAR